MTAFYYENDKTIERDSVEDLETAEEWFTDSYNYHSGEFPNEDEVNCFLRGKEPVAVYDKSGNLFMEWKLNR